MAELTPDPSPGPRSQVAHQSLRVLPWLAVAAAAIGLFEHPVGTAAAVTATLAVMATTLLRLAVEARGWTAAVDRRYLLAVVALVVVIGAGALLGVRG